MFLIQITSFILYIKVNKSEIKTNKLKIKSILYLTEIDFSINIY